MKKFIKFHLTLIVKTLKLYISLGLLIIFNFEKFLFKKIPLWFYILTLVLGIIFLALFGSVVRHVVKGGTMTGQIGIIALNISKFPEIYKFVKQLRFRSKSSNFETNQEFVLKIHNEELFKNSENVFANLKL